MKPHKPIRTDADYRIALQELSALWHEVQPDTPEGDYFEVLAVLVDDYEEKHFPILTKGEKMVRLLQKSGLYGPEPDFSSIGRPGKAICGAKSPGDPDDEFDPPVTCSEPPGHSGDHGGGTRCGTVTWPKTKSR